MDNSPLHWRGRRAGQVQGEGRVATKRGGKTNIRKVKVVMMMMKVMMIKTGWFQSEVTGGEVVIFAGDWKESG